MPEGYSPAATYDFCRMDDDRRDVSTIIDEDLRVPGPNGEATEPLFDRTSVMIATVLGTTVAGAFLMYLNAQRLHRDTGARHLAIGAAIMVAFVVVGLFLPEGIPTFLYTLVQLFILRAYFDTKQGPAVEAHGASGGAMESRWKAAGIGLAGLVLVAGGLFAFFYVLSDDNGDLPF